MSLGGTSSKSKMMPDCIWQDVCGKIAPPTASVDSAVKIGEAMLEQFEKTWPEVFYNTISSKVKTMATTTKSIKIGDSKIYDLNVIYSRTIVLFSSDRDVDVKDVLAYELAPVPTAMFTEDGMRICKAKSTLKKSLQVEVSRRNAGDADAGLDVRLIMESPRKERAIVDIKATLSKHSEIVENLLPAHAISGCDTVASYYGLGKGSVIKVLKAGYELSATWMHHSSKSSTKPLPSSQPVMA
ncbi:hypothetical protein NQZ68_032226 [Dissostichus eleginoides]|nr:hypothetical protein NQZ68_032226 [Dissostichus eleginoides]